MTPGALAYRPGALRGAPTPWTALICGVALAACGGGESDRADKAEASGQVLRVEGSDTMLYLSREWATAYESAHMEVDVRVEGGGSGRGIAALLNGDADLANASRPMREREKFLLMQGRSKTAREFPVALDALAVFVNRDNPVQSLTIDQLRRIYVGELTNWREVGGPDLAITVYNRDEASGTYAYFQDHVLDGAAYTDQAEVIPETAKIIEAVKDQKGGIGYGGIAYVEEAHGTVHGVDVASAEDGVPIAPTMENAVHGLYPLARLLYVYSAGTPTALQEDFLDFVRSARGQKIIEEVGYYPLPDRLPEALAGRGGEEPAEDGADEDEAAAGSAGAAGDAPEGVAPTEESAPGAAQRTGTAEAEAAPAPSEPAATTASAEAATGAE
jgi:phosphate transport system substrate-binding protein